MLGQSKVMGAKFSTSDVETVPSPPAAPTVVYIAPDGRSLRVAWNPPDNGGKIVTKSYPTPFVLLFYGFG